MERRKRVVVVGGGVAGSIVAKSMQLHADVVLVDPKEYFEIPWANLRARVEPSFAERTVVNHEDYFGHGRIVVSRAVDVTETEVVTREGHHLGYDFLVIATGHTDSVARTRRGRLDQFGEDNQKIKSSSSILLVGGGPTGVELAAEIAVDFPEKKVTLVHSGKRLLSFVGSKAAAKALEWLKSKKVEVVLDDSVDLESASEADREFITSAGRTITADCFFDCTGRPLGSSWLKETHLDSCIDRQGRVMVDESLRVQGKKNIFAIGDITDVKEIKQGLYAQRQASVVAKNLKLLIRGAGGGYLHRYKPGPVMAIVTLGRKEAVAQFPVLTMVGHVPGKLKSGDLFVGRTRRHMGLDSDLRRPSKH